MGDSRAFYQINPDSFKMKTYNLSHAGMGQSFQTGLLNVLDQEKKLPPIILLHINLEEYIKNEAAENPFDVQNLKYYHGKNKLVTDYIDEISEFEKYKYYFELYRYNGRVINLVKNLIETKQTNDFGNGYIAVGAGDRDSINIVLYAEKETENKSAVFNYDRLKHLNKFLEICIRNKVKLICFTSPFYNKWNFNITASNVLDSVFKTKNIEYINYAVQPVPMLEKHPFFWKDTGHLNHHGAKIESGDLSKQVNEILKK